MSYKTYSFMLDRDTKVKLNTKKKLKTQTWDSFFNDLLNCYCDRLSSNCSKPKLIEKKKKTTKKNEEYVISNLLSLNKPTEVYTDGATVGHNGKLGTVSEVTIGVYIPALNVTYGERMPGMSNNEAEFKALLSGMEYCIEHDISEAIFKMDSMVVVSRCTRFRKNPGNRRMAYFQKEVEKLKKKFTYIDFQYIPREQNAVADHYSNLAKNY